jgi:ribosomal protein S1
MYPALIQKLGPDQAFLEHFPPLEGLGHFSTTPWVLEG